MPEAAVQAISNLASPLEGSPLSSAGFQERKEELLFDELWDNPPPWGGSWKDFFSVFNPDSDGLTRTEINQICPGDPDIFPHSFQYVLQCAILDGLLESREIHHDQTLTIGSKAVVQRESEERLSLNLNSPKLNALLSEPGTAVATNKIADFISINFSKIAQQNQIELTDSEAFATKFIDFLGSQGKGKTFYTSGVYKEPSLNPNPEECFTRNLATFLDEVIAKAVELGLVSENEVNGRPGYRLA